MTKKDIVYGNFHYYSFFYKKNAPGRERKPVTLASNEGLTSGATG